VRAIDLETRRTTTLLGTGLFDWGDGEGALGPRLIQHPLAVAAQGEGVWVADSYNGKIKWIGAARETPVGSSKLERIDTRVQAAAGKQLSDPGGVFVDKDGSLLIADTGNARILRLAKGSTEPTVVAVGRRDAAPEVAGPAARPSVSRSIPAVPLEERHLAVGPTTLSFALIAPRGFAFSDGAPWSVELSGASLKPGAPVASGEATAGERVELQAAVEIVGSGELMARVHANICDAVNHAACYPVRGAFTLPVTIGGTGAKGSIALPLSAPAMR
jgi:hypothetical protein